MAHEYTTPPGRIVWGHPIEAQKRTDDDNKPVKDEDGNQLYRWSFGLAVPKEQCTEMFGVMTAEANTIYPNGQPANFAWKFKDGDTELDSNGNPLRDKPGYAGCYVFAIDTFLGAPPFYIYDHVKGQYVAAESGVKRGDFVRVMVEFSAHAPVGRGKPGMYINPRGVLFYEAGEEIKGGSAPDPNALNIAPPPKPAAPPAGALPGQPAQPTAPSAAPGVPGQPAQPAPAAPAAAPGVPGAHQDFVNGPQVPGQPAATPPGVPGQ